MAAVSTEKVLRKYFAEDLGLDVQTFNLLAFAGMAAGVLVAVSSIITKAGPENIFGNFGITAISYFFLHYARRTGRYHMCYWIVVVAVFLVAYPILFFAAGGYRSGMPCFFVFSLVFTALMLKGKERAAALTAGFALYIFCCLLAYFRPETVTPFAGEFEYTLDVITGVVVSSALLLLIFVLYTRIHNRNQQKLEELNRLKIEFLGNMSHELKTPLTSVYGFAKHSYGVMADDWPIDAKGLDEMRDNLRLIILESERMKRIVDELLDIATVEQGGFILKKELVSIGGLAREISGIQFRVINTNENRIELDLSPDLPGIYADPDRLRQVLLNLIANASRHTINGVIVIAASVSAGNVKLSVTDNGEGIPNDLQGSIFERYLGAEAGRAHGTGLGLYICKLIVEAHGGKIFIESEPGAGTTAWFTLPLEGG